MLFFRILIGSVAFTLISSFATAEVLLGTNLSSFDQLHNRGGGSVAHVHCIFSRIGYRAEVQHMPWRRARQEVSSGKIDGFFTAMSLPEVDKYARLSAPLVLENWYWYHRVNPFDEASGAPESMKLGAILGSHQEAWLEDAGYRVHLRVNSLEQLLKLLLSGRIDGFVADRDHLAAASKLLGLTSDAYEETFLRYMPLGVYFGKAFLAEHPRLLPEFDRHIHECAPAAFVMSGEEQRRLRQWLAPLMKDWLRTEPIHQMLEKQNKAQATLPQTELLARDGRWRREFQTGGGDLSESILSRALSRRLRELAVDTQGLITEVMLTDKRGFNVAVSDLTSDYWQGDEDKFQEAWILEQGQLHFDTVVYDESTRLFQIHVSRPVYHPETGRPMGVLIVGVDVEKALAVD